MPIRSITFLLFMFGVLFVHAKVSLAQDEASSPSATKQKQSISNQKEEDKLKRERKAMALLEEVVSEAQAMHLPENRIRVQVAAGDMFWAPNQARARALFTEAAAAIALSTGQSDRSDSDAAETMMRLRRELVLTAARHDSDLAFQLLNSTRPLRRTNNGPNQFDASSDERLEQSLLSILAASDPKVAYQKALESLDRGEYSVAISNVLRQLYSKDRETFEKLSKKLMSKLTTNTLIDSEEAGKLAVDLLDPGPIPVTSTADGSPNTKSSNPPGPIQALTESACAHHGAQHQTRPGWRR